LVTIGDSGEVTRMADTITPPGKGRIIPCPDCNGLPGRDCAECQGEGRYIMRSCPLCGDPGWRAQVLPGSPT